MSMSVHISTLKKTVVLGHTLLECVDTYEADSWCLWLMGDLVPLRQPSPYSIIVHKDWIVSPAELEDLHEYCVVRAGDIKGEHFQLPTWHPDRVARGMAIEAYIESLPDDTMMLARLV